MLAEIIHKIAAAEYAGKKEQTYRPRPSLAGPERCIRQLVYMAQGKEKKSLGGRAITVMDDSAWHAELTLDWLRKSAYKVHSEEMEIRVGDMVGHIDAIVTDIIGGEYVLEHKAIAHFSWLSL